MFNSTNKEFLGSSEKNVQHNYVYRDEKIHDRNKYNKCEIDREIDVNKV